MVFVFYNSLIFPCFLCIIVYNAKHTVQHMYNFHFLSKLNYKTQLYFQNGSCKIISLKFLIRTNFVWTGTKSLILADTQSAWYRLTKKSTWNRLWEFATLTHSMERRSEKKLCGKTANLFSSSMNFWPKLHIRTKYTVFFRLLVWPAVFCYCF